ncbi:MAG: bifunctional 3-deoxy-7-phosphoheptulonate synthase/chorismate mutase type II [Alistipes sp.]|nr:bifunctional 3-deoxy-7-phosphoheptulonate synthase/chorismate mutase type II [Alistipes sp.]
MENLKPLFPELVPGEPVIIAGPCSAESEEQVLAAAEELHAGGIGMFRAGVWKPRTKPGGFEGVGVQALGWLREVRERTGMRVATEVATSHHVELALASGVDMLWIGARTSANPFAVQEIADALRGADVAVLVKNPISPDLELWIGAIERIRNSGIRRLGAVHRGFSSYEQSLYRNDPQWAVPIELRHRLPGLPLLCDPSHIGGRRELVADIAQRAMDLGFDGLIVESHCTPDRAWSDAAQQVTPSELLRILGGLTLRTAPEASSSLAESRAEIDHIDNELLALLARRMKISRAIGSYKREHGMPILQPQRYEELLRTRAAQSERLGMSSEFICEILRAIHEESVRQQL